MSGIENDDTQDFSVGFRKGFHLMKGGEADLDLSFSEVVEAWCF